MKIVMIISNFIIPVIILSTILFGYSAKINIYESFVEGAKDGLKTVFNILPTLIGILFAVTIFRASGAMDFLVLLLSKPLGVIGFPPEILPLGLLRLISSSAATGVLLDIFKTLGPDSFTGRMAAIIMSSTETIFYTMSVYFMSIGVKKTRYTLFGALISSFVGIIASFFAVLLIFGR